MNEHLKPYSKYVQKYKLVLDKQAFKFERTVVMNSADLSTFFQMLHSMEGDDIVEHFYIAFFNQCRRLMGYTYLSKGGINGVTADLRIIMVMALQSGAVQIAVCHNHPSGALKPSDADASITQKLKDAAAFHDIRLMDHVIISEEGYYSFADEGLL